MTNLTILDLKQHIIDLESIRPNPDTLDGKLLHIYLTQFVKTFGTQSQLDLWLSKDRDILNKW